MNIIFLVVIVFIGWLFITYNVFIQLRNRADEAWSDIDVQLKKRFDLLPNLVTAVKAYAKHEKELFEEVANMRSQMLQTTSVREREQADRKAKETIASLFAVAENYPKLMASSSFTLLQTQLTDIENTIASARKYYNATVRNFNIRVHSFPDMFIARVSGFVPREFFEATDEERNVTQIKT